MQHAFPNHKIPVLNNKLIVISRNIIDVAAADSVMMEPNEYMDRARQYKYVCERLGLENVALKKKMEKGIFPSV